MNSNEDYNRSRQEDGHVPKRRFQSHGKYILEGKTANQNMGNHNSNHDQNLSAKRFKELS